MKSIRIITGIMLVLFALFLVMNCIYTFLAIYRHLYGQFRLFSPEFRMFMNFISWMNIAYLFVNIFLYVGLCLFLLFCNRFIKKNRLGKGYHFMIVVIGFLPIVNWFLPYIIWLKLNKNSHDHFRSNSKTSSLKIIFSWIFSIGSALFFLVSTFLITWYSSSPEMVTTFEANRNLAFLVSFSLLIGFSVAAFSYYWSFLKQVRRSDSLMNGLPQSQLLDE